MASSSGSACAETMQPVMAFLSGSECALVWDAKGALWLREHCHLPFVFVGSEPNGKKRTISKKDDDDEHKWNELISGGLRMPVVLMPEEIDFCLEKGWIVLHSSADIVNRKTVCTTDSAAAFTNGDVTLEEIGSFTAASGRKKIRIPLEMHAAGGNDGNANAIEWHFPATAAEQRRCAVYRDLWSKGYWISSGLKFGGDFLAYEKDPFYCHACVVIVIVDWDDIIQPGAVVGAARVSGAACKLSVFASVNPQGQVQYISFQYAC